MLAAGVKPQLARHRPQRFSFTVFSCLAKRLAKRSFLFWLSFLRIAFRRLLPEPPRSAIRP
jgi:hypothetical protein